jgi:glutathione peroxidase
MLKPIQNILLACLMCGTVAAETKILEAKVKTIDGKETTLATYKPKAVLIVNTASECGFTRQYKGLEALHQKFGKKGLVVAGFPCNQFGGQEPGTNDEIAKFCKSKYDVSFPMFAKIEVNGDKQHEIYGSLTGKKSPFPGKVGWNFTKFLVGADGTILARFTSGNDPMSDKVIAEVEKALAAAKK